MGTNNTSVIMSGELEEVEIEDITAITDTEKNHLFIKPLTYDEGYHKIFAKRYPEISVKMYPEIFSGKYPEIFDADTGNLILIIPLEIEYEDEAANPISEVEEENHLGKDLSDLAKVTTTLAAKEAIEKGGKILSKKAKIYALAQLENGKIVTNTGKEYSRITQSNTYRPIKTRTISTNSGKVMTVKMASDFGYNYNGQQATTKGIDQLKAFENKHFSHKFKIKGLLKAAGSLFDLVYLVDFTLDLTNGKTPSLPLPIPYANKLTDMILERTFGHTLRSVDESLQVDFNYTKTAGLRKIKAVVNGGSIFVEQKGYGIIEVSYETASRILNGEYTNIEDVINDAIRYGGEDVSILYREVAHPNFVKNICIIESFYIKTDNNEEDIYFDIDPNSAD